MAETYKPVAETPPAHDPGAPEAARIPPSRPKGKAKGVVLLGIWLALLAGLIVGINVMSQPPVITPGLVKSSTNPMPNLTAAKLEADWPQIVAQAAAPPRGQSGVRYTLAEFGDFQCPQCGKVRPVLEKILAQYPSQVNMIFLHRPFPNLHEWALPSGQASEIAAAQGKFWPMYDVLYSHQDDLEPGFYGKYAAEAGLDEAGFQKAFNAGQGAERVKASSKFADSEYIQETPTIVVHDGVAKTVAIYIGLDTRKNAEQGIPFPGVDKLIAEPPWGK